MTIQEQLKALFRSRKFWALLTALATTAAAFSAGKIDGWQAVLAVIASTQVYALATAVEDAGK
jgi:hypothetical protein